MSEQFAHFTYDGIPDLPDIPADPLPAQPPQQFNQPRRGGAMDASNGIPKFEVVAKRRADGSYHNVEYVTVLTPGDPKAQPRHKVTDEIRNKYAPYYRMFRQGLEASPEGTPLESWPVMTPAQIRELKANNIFTVEQLRDMPDSSNHRIPMVRTLKNRATQWLETKKNADAVDAQARENETLRNGMSMLEKQIADLQTRLDATGGEESSAAVLEAPASSGNIDEQLDAAVDKATSETPKRKPGRPKKSG